MYRKNEMIAVSLGLSVLLSGVVVAGAASAASATPPTTSVMSSTYSGGDNPALAPPSSPSPAYPTFTDLAGHWANTSIERAVRMGYVDGYEDATFRPDKSVSRAEFIKMVVASLHLNVSASATAGDAWYASYVQAAAKAKLYMDGEYATGDLTSDMSRFEMTRVMVRSLDPSFQSADRATDDDAIMYKATRLGLIQGMDDQGTLAGDEPMTRAQAVTIVERLLAAKQGAKLPVDQNAVNQASIPALHNNFLEYGLTPKVTFPYTLEVKGMKVTIHEAYLYDTSSGRGQELFDKYNLAYTPRRGPRPSTLLWTKVTFENTGTSDIGFNANMLVDTISMGMHESGAIDGAGSFSEEYKDRNDPEIVDNWLLKPGESYTAHDAFFPSGPIDLVNLNIFNGASTANAILASR